ncbi:MAG: inositol monophosphatase [Chloroflexi bacterium]|nr:inositol monophosphatase [Chloroflexota bacterium]
MASASHPAALDPELLASIEAHAADLAARAGNLLLSYFPRPLEVAYKSKDHANPVTEADRASEKLLVEGIGERFPSHAILSEEAPDTPTATGEFLWVLDPLDGTTNFLNRFPFWGVSIAVLHQGVPVAAALFIPALATQGSQVLRARAGAGAYLGDAPVRLPAEAAPSDRRLSAMPAYFWGQFRVRRELRRQIGELRTTGSIACELALVSTGALQFAAFTSPKIWDVAAGVLILQEAGGQTLVRSERRQWKPFTSFQEPGAGLPLKGDIREWGASLLVGSPATVGLVSQGLRPRRGLRRWLRRLIGRRRR